MSRFGRRTRSLHAWVAVAALLAPACARLDTGPPTVVDRVPAPGSSNVWIGDNIEVRFDRAMDPATAAGLELSTDSGAAVPVEWSWSSDGHSLRGAVSERPDVPATLTLTLPIGLADHAGRAVVQPDEAHAWHVPSWQQLGTPLRSPAATGGADDPAIAIGPDGTIAVTWYENREGGRAIVAAVWDEATGAWEHLADAARPEDGDFAAEPAIVVDHAERVVVAWRDTRDGRNHVSVARWDAETRAWLPLGGPLGEPFAAPPEPDETRAPALAVDADGALHVAVSEFEDFYATMLRRWDEDDDAWVWLPFAFTAWYVDGPHTSSDYPALTFDGQGRAVVAHYESRPSATRHVYVGRRSAATGTWTFLGGGSLSAAGARGGRVSLATGPTGDVWAAWNERPDGATRSDLHVQRYDDAGGAWVELPVDPPMAADEPDVLSPVGFAVDSLGRLVVAWRARLPDDTHHRSFVHRYEVDSDTWTLLGPRLGLQTDAAVGMTRLALDAFDAPVVAYRDGSVGGVVVQRWNGP